MPRGSEMPGGHTVQLTMTAEALRRLGVDVVESYDDAADLGDVDLVHGCGLTPAQVHDCRRLGLPVVISTIYWGNAYEGDRYQRRALSQLPSAALRGGRLSRAVLSGHGTVVTTCLDEARREVEVALSYAAADALLPNARGEAAAIQRDLGVPTPWVFVPNGVSPERFGPGHTPFAERDRVVCVGRIEPHKNQLGLIRALRGTGLRLVVVGVPHPHHPDYSRLCEREGRGWVEFTGRVSLDDLAASYRSARVHALASWFETTGLVSLEAALSGCSVVTTSRGHAREYLGDLARYCDPADEGTIRRAVLAAWDEPPGPALAQRVLDNYTWDHAAVATLEAYQQVLDRPDRRRRTPVN